MIGFIIILAVMEIIPINCHLKRSKGHGSITWGYRKNGPKTWPKLQKTCGGFSQSPIYIMTDSVQQSYGTNLLLSHNYDELPVAEKYNLVNNGHALQMNIPKTVNYVLTKNSIKYIPQQVHIHFNSKTGKGSEHTVDFKHYFAEIHIVHQRSDSVGVNKFGDLLVVAMFADLVKGGDAKTSVAMKVFADATSQIKNADDATTVPAFPLSDLLPQQPIKGAKFIYVNYSGSLTTPPCSEIVDWVVITGKKLIITPKDAKKLGKVKSAEGKAMAGNNRPVQPLNGRKVYGIEWAF